MTSIVSIKNLTKTYAGGLKALNEVSLEIDKGEILALLGPNGAGKTTLISAVCGIVQPTSGTVTVDGYDNAKNWRQARAMIGLVPQEMAVDIFTPLIDVVNYSRGLFGLPKNPAYIEKVLRSLSLWDKKDARINTLSGGMKRRVLIAKALSHEPRILFLDEPTAGVDVELRKDMWQVVRDLRDDGVTIILTTHYIEEAEAMADRVAVINGGRILLVEDKAVLMRKLGQKRLHISLKTPVATLPRALAKWGLTRGDDGNRLTYAYDTQAEHLDITALLADIAKAGLDMRDMDTEESSLEEIFVSLVRKEP